MTRQSRCSSGSSVRDCDQQLVGEVRQDRGLGALGRGVGLPTSSVVISRRVRPALKWSVARLRAMVISQAPKSSPCHRKFFMFRSARKNVSEARYRRAGRSGAVEEEPVDRGVVVVVEQAERLGVAATGKLDERDQSRAIGLGVLRGGGQLGVVVARRRRCGRDRGRRRPLRGGTRRRRAPVAGEVAPGARQRARGARRRGQAGTSGQQRPPRAGLPSRARDSLTLRTTYAVVLPDRRPPEPPWILRGRGDVGHGFQ